jgi:hypothetical protein
MKETLRRRITVTSSFNDESTDQMGIRAAVTGGRYYSVRIFLLSGFRTGI